MMFDLYLGREVQHATAVSCQCQSTAGNVQFFWRHEEDVQTRELSADPLIKLHLLQLHMGEQYSLCMFT